LATKSEKNKPTKIGQLIPSSLIAQLQKRSTRNGSHRRKLKGRLTVEHVGRVIGDIGEKAGVVVQSAKGKKAKYASAHDIRRGFAQRLINAGVSAETLKVVMRHRDFSTTERYYGATKRAQSAAVELAEKLEAECTNSELVGTLVVSKDGSSPLTSAQLEKLKSLLAMI